MEEAAPHRDGNATAGALGMVPYQLIVLHLPLQRRSCMKRGMCLLHAGDVDAKAGPKAVTRLGPKGAAGQAVHVVGEEA